MDPYADAYFALSSYSWAANNPMKFIDPDGREIINTAQGITFTEHDAVNQSAFGFAVYKLLFSFSADNEV